jgi:ApaG protein
MPDAKHKITVQAKVTFIPDQSDSESNRYAFAYTITVNNTGTLAARLISRHWIITDSDSQIQEVRGDGVVGEQPLLEPGQSFQYTSGAIIATPVGTMRGTYHMLADDGTKFDADIPEFTLAMPRMLH